MSAQAHLHVADVTHLQGRTADGELREADDVADVTHLHGRTTGGELREADDVAEVDGDAVELFGDDGLAADQLVRHRPAARTRKHHAQSNGESMCLQE